MYMKKIYMVFLLGAVVILGGVAFLLKDTFISLIQPASVNYALMSHQSFVTVTSKTAFAQALKKSQPGDVIEISGEKNPTSRVSWGSITVAYGGSVASPVTIKNSATYPITFTGSTKFIFTASHVVFDGFHFESGLPVPFSLGSGYTTRGILSVGNPKRTVEDIQILNNTFLYSGYSKKDKDDAAAQGKALTTLADIHTLPNTQHLIVKGNTFGYNQFMTIGILLSNTSGFNTITQNYFHDFSANAGVNGMEAIQMGAVATLDATGTQLVYNDQNEISYNQFYKINGESELISIKNSGNTIHHNTFSYSDSAVSLRSGSNNTVSANLFYKTHGGIRVFGSNHTISRNVIIEPIGYGAFILPFGSLSGKVDANGTGSRSRTPATGNTFVNNVLFSLNQAGVSFLKDLNGCSKNAVGDGECELPPSNNTFLNNLFVITSTKAKSVHAISLFSIYKDMASTRYKNYTLSDIVRGQDTSSAFLSKLGIEDGKTSAWKQAIADEIIPKSKQGLCFHVAPAQVTTDTLVVTDFSWVACGTDADTLPKIIVE
jgi:hypothetical protein